ncbi:SRPBCC family protein [Mucilaginibacter myungsuensis]|uniref:SRPBCC domain-containing protein n=1 Tax=Mucilaginibacter myungsuensis TaxID=649104 RepID=A0A929PY97_9SPHI|nr:SRPBCC domain-containing protein [Mucilaginibacter myungsuensis]MBE9664668.1 SRPBCC domain-containing protein [Mucilaginibacter myungsuensis]MDN3601127.1 SRPBCC domain-containing protein [Mucilaginibacter myungsuensis]
MESTSQTSEPLIVERVLNAPATKIWEALSDINKIKQWYFQLEEFKAEVGFTFEFEGGDETQVYLHRCVITEVIPGKKLAYTWAYPEFHKGESEVSFELFPEGDRTLVRITHVGLENFPSHLPSFARESFNGGWNHILGISLKDFVEKG